MIQMWYAVHLDFDRHRDLLFHFLRRSTGPLRNHLNPRIRHIGISFHGQLFERDRPPRKQQQSQAHHNEAIVEREGDQCANHYCCTVFWNSRAFVTTCWPIASPESTSCLLPANMAPPRTSIRRNFLFPAGTYTQSRSCKCRIAVAGTAGRDSFLLPWNVAVTNMPTRIKPGLRTSMRTFDVRRLGSSTGPTLLIVPVNTRSGYAFKRMSAFSPRCTLARSFSYTSQRIQT